MTAPISVVIPTYNGSQFIVEALDSVFAQTLAPREVIVVDDASTDGTADLVAAVARRAPVPLRLIRLRKNSGGPARPINIGIEAASGALIAVCEQDDRFLPEKLHEQATLLAHDPGLTFVFGLTGDYYQTERVLQSPETVELYRQSGVVGDGSIRLDAPAVQRFLVPVGLIGCGFPGFMFRRKDWQIKGGLDESLTIAADFELLCWLSERGAAGFIPRVHYLRRFHEGNATRHTLRMFVEHYGVLSRHLARNPHLLRDAEVSRKVSQDLLDFAYWVREAGRHLDALRCYLSWARVWGIDKNLAKSIIKTILHLIYATVTFRAPVYTPQTTP